MKPESKDQSISLKWEWWLSCLLLVLAIVVTTGVVYFSNFVEFTKHPECILPRWTVISFYAAYVPVVTSSVSFLLVVCMVHWGASKRFLSFWRIICLMTVALITFTLAGIFLYYVPNSCEFR
jgi:hypothetical protein